MATTARARSAPAHLWIVGILATLWNGYACYDYLMTVTKNQAYLSGLPADQLAYYETLPTWLTGAWALGVWGGIAGSLLLLARSRHAVLAFAVSLIGVIATFGYQMTMTDMPASMKEGGMMLVPFVIGLIAIGLLYYAWKQEKKGLLR
jgi:hypothetical protein